MTRSPDSVLVTGVAGFIGARLAETLLEEGCTVDGVDDLCDSYDPRLKRARLDGLLGRERFRFHESDVADETAISELFSRRRSEGPWDAVLHLAARAGIRASVLRPELYVRTNVVGTLNLLEASRRSGTKTFLLASSSSVYGRDSATPFRESNPAGGARSPYAATKLAAEELCHAFDHLHGIRAVCLRYFTVFGPAGRPDMGVFRFIRQILDGEPLTIYGDGSQRRDLTFVDDIVRGTIAALRTGHSGNVNLGGDRPVAVLDLVRAVEELTGRTARIQLGPAEPADAPETWADNSRAREWLGWEPRVPWRDGLERTVRWHRDRLDLVRSLRPD